MDEQMQLKKLTQKEGHTVESIFSCPHSLLEDTVYLLLLEFPLYGYLEPVGFFAIAVVWGPRLYNFINAVNVIKNDLWKVDKLFCFGL
jgi:hypothetical protein